MIAFYGLNGRRLTLTNDQAYDLVMKVARVNWTRSRKSQRLFRVPPHLASNLARIPA